jgi:hypothetical protein
MPATSRRINASPPPSASSSAAAQREGTAATETHHGHFNDDALRNAATTGETREAVRARLLAHMPRGYVPWLHLAATTGVAATLLGLGVVCVHEATWLEWAVVPAVLIVANAFEWRVHKDVLHRRRWPWGAIYDQHTPMHHKVYHHTDMALRDWRELRLVLIPAVGVVGIVVALAPLALALGLLWSPNAAWLALVSAGTYMVSYELLHLAYHLPRTHPVARFGLVRWLSRHHARHHDPRLMQHWNFNVTLPLFDWLMGTYWTEARERRRLERRRLVTPGDGGARATPAANEKPIAASARGA